MMIKKLLNKYLSFELTSFLFLMLIFPIYHLWKAWLAFGVWELNKNYSYLPGLLFILILSWGYLKNIDLNWKQRFPEFLFVLFILWALSLVGWDRVNTGNTTDSLGRNAFIFNFKIILFYTAHFLAGYFFPELRKYYTTLFCFWGLMILNTFYFTDFNVLTFDSNRVVVHKYLGEYPQWGDSLALVSLWLLVLTKNIKLKVILLLLSTAALYIIGSRTSFYLYIAVTPIVLIFLRNYKLLLLMVIFIAVTLACIKYQVFSSNRIGLFFTPAKDNSLKIRYETIIEGWQVITSSTKNIIIGDLNGQIHKHKDIGAYIHGHLSLWRQFGIFPFLPFLSIAPKIMIKSFHLLKKPFHQFEEVNINMIIILATSIYIFTQALFVRGYVSPYSWLCFGMLFQYRKSTVL